ncbi:MAG: flippase [bacterium]|nr:flippase [bacterium]
MSLEARIFYNTLAQTLGKTVAVLIGLATIAVLTQYLGESGFGQYSTVLAFLGLFVITADFGLYLYVVREISKTDTNHKEILSNALGLRLTTALALLALGAAIAWLFPYDPLVKKTMFVGVFAFLFVSLNQVLIGIFQKHLVQHLVVFSETVGRLVNLLLILAFVKFGLNLPFFVLALVGSNATIFLLTLVFAKRYEQFGIAFDFSVWKKIILSSWPLIFGVILNLVYFKTDTVILSIFHPPETVGVYSLPYKFLEGLLAFPAMFVGLVMPLLSKAAFVDWGRFKKIMQSSFDALLLMAILVIAAVWFFAQPMVDLVKGKQEYFDSPALLQILIFAAGTIFLGTLFGYAVVAVNEQRAMIKGYLLGAIVGLLLYFALIPRFGYWGAAVGTVTTEIVVGAYAYALVRKTSRQKLSLGVLLRASPAILGLVLFFKFVEMQWMLEIIIGGILYLLALILFRAIPRGLVEEITFSKR